MAYIQTADKLYIGNFSETVKENGKYYKVGIMFSIGTHRGVEYTREDIEQLVREFDPEDFVPVQLDHSESARDTVGFIREAYAEGDNLMGKLEIIDEEAQKRIDKGLMKKLSVSFYLKQIAGKLQPYKIREVSLVAFPQVKGAQLFSETKGGTKMTDKQRERLTELLDKVFHKSRSLTKQEVKEVQELFGLLQRENEEKNEEENNSADEQKDNFHEGKSFDEFYEEYCQKHGYGQGYYDEQNAKAMRGEANKQERKEFSYEDNSSSSTRSDYEKFNNVDDFYEEYVKKFGTSL
ncbi:UNVERIFIED_ORG: hypothetical protein J2X74_003831 [Bacillus sp. 1751]|nr:hypothetical protein [Bacillus sp. 1751]